MSFILKQLKEQNEKFGELDFQVINFIFKDWNVYYNLYNLENFEDPENSPEWYDASDVYQYYQKPYSNTEKVSFYSSKKVENFNIIEYLINKSNDIENTILDFLVNYTFGAGGAYAASKHYEYAKRTMEILHKTKFTNEEFIKRNLRINTICIGQEDNELELIFDCSWDEEHGLKICLKNNEIKSIE